MTKKKERERESYLNTINIYIHSHVRALLGVIEDTGK